MKYSDVVSCFDRAGHRVERIESDGGCVAFLAAAAADHCIPRRSRIPKAFCSTRLLSAIRQHFLKIFFMGMAHRVETGCG